MTDRPPSNTPHSATPRWLRVIFLISLALNLIVAGVVIGTVFGGMDIGKRNASLRPLNMPYTRAVSAQDRGALMKSLQRELRTERPTRSDIREDYTRALDILRADPFQPDVLAKHFETQVDRSQKRIAAGQRVLLSYLNGLSSEEREAYATRLEEALQRPERGDRPRH